MRARVAGVVAVAVAGVALAPGIAPAGPMIGIGEGGLGPGFGRSIDEGLDVGPEVTALGSFASDTSAAAIGVDLVIAFYLDEAVELKNAYGTREGLTDLLLTRTVKRPRRWPFLSQQALALHLGGVFDVEGGRSQLHLAAGSGVGPVGLAIGAVYEVTEGPNAWGFGPEVRLRHRFGPSRNTASLGLLVRLEVFAYERELHPDRLTIGLFGMWGW